MQTIKIANDKAIQAPPVGQPENPTEIPAPGKMPPSAAPNALKGTISEADALKAVEGAKISTLQPFSPSGTSPASSGQSVPVGGLMDAKLAVDLMDAVLPSALVIGGKFVGLEMKKTDLQLTEREKGTFHPVVQKCLDQLMLNFSSPWTALAVTAVVIYGAKVGEKGVVKKMDDNIAKAELKEMQKAAPKVETPVAPVVQMTAGEMKDPARKVPVDVSKVEWEPADPMIRAAVRDRKCSRKVAILYLKKLYAEGKHDRLQKIKL
jgi:hypothetical protein